MFDVSRIKSVKVTNLFEMFNYDISYPNDEDILIITGPNGYGKTQLLNIIFNLFNGNLFYFYSIDFEEIVVTLENESACKVVKHSDIISFLFFYKGEETLEFSFEDKDEQLLKYIISRFPIEEIDSNKWFDYSIKKHFDYNELLAEYANLLPDQYKMYMHYPKVIHFFNSLDVHLIKEQRLFKKTKRSRRTSLKKVDSQTVFTDTINEYSKELKELISLNTQKSFEVSQTLDSSYPSRLIKSREGVSQDEYEQKFKVLKEKQDKLVKFGLSEESQKVLEYSKEDSKALFIYLSDLEEKISVFDELVEKLDLFSSILNQRRFTYKRIKIDRQKGFYFETYKGKLLKMNQLSSGEQHEVILLYELIFKTSPEILVMIDEPEISLHITWQKEFLDDLLKIIKLQKFQVIIATHSPSIINDRWDLVYSLKSKLND